MEKVVYFVYRYVIYVKMLLTLNVVFPVQHRYFLIYFYKTGEKDCNSCSCNDILLVRVFGLDFI